MHAKFVVAERAEPLFVEADQGLVGDTNLFDLYTKNNFNIISFLQVFETRTSVLKMILALMLKKVHSYYNFLVLNMKWRLNAGYKSIKWQFC